jgi:hypothetical protein
MPPPTKHDIKVATDSLRTAAGVWDRQSDVLATLARQVEGLRMDRGDAGIFQVMVSTYQDTVQLIADRCSEGHRRTAEIADALRAAARTYDEEERKGEHAFRNLY